MRDLTVDNNSQASTPGRLAASRLQWFRCYPKWPLIWLIALVLFALLSAIHSKGWLFLAVPVLAMNWLYWVRVREHFGSGNVCPAVVISTSPLLLAVSTDLSTGGSPQPAIKVIKVPRASLTMEVVQVGDRVPTVALYSRAPESSDSWQDFDPRPVGSATSDRATVEAVLTRIPEEYWEELHLWKSSVPNLRIGLHRVR